MNHAMTTAQMNALTEEQLDDLILQALARCRPPQRKWAELVGAGVDQKEAIRTAYGARRKTSGGQPMKNVAVARAVAFLREKHSRKAGTTAQEIRSFWVKLRDTAFNEGKYDAANRANEMLAKLGGLFPEQAIRLQLEAPAVEPRTISADEWMELARLRHVVRPSLPATVDAVPASGLDSGLHTPNPVLAAASAIPAQPLGDKEGDNDA